MNSMISRSGFLAAALTVAALAGCNAVEDVRTEPFTELPPAKVVLQGTVTGLGSKRSIVLTNNGVASSAITVIAPVPVVAATGGGGFPAPFTFGALDDRDANGSPVPYNIEIRTSPYGKVCSVQAGTGSGVLSAESPPNVVVNCVPAPGVSLYDLTVILDAAFASAPGAKVTLRTEEALYEQAVTLANIASGTMTFEDKLFNANALATDGPIPSPAPPGGSPRFDWTVSASTSVGGTVNRCPVLRPSNPSVTVTTSPGPPPVTYTYTANPSGNISGAGVAPQVQACAFTVSGTVHYSRPAGVIADPARGAGLTLELRDQGGFVKGTAAVAAGAFPANFTFNNTNTPATTAFTSNPNADFQVVVTGQPAGQTCIAVDGGYVSLRALVGLNPTNVTGTGVLTTGLVPAAGAAASTNLPVAGTRLIIFCRNAPALADRLSGVYRLTNTVAEIWRQGAGTPVPAPTVETVSNPWQPYNPAVQNTASSNFLAFFDDGTFLYGTHHNQTQIEHGFYDYSATLPAATGAPPGRLRFTLHTDTFFNTTFPTTFSNAEQNVISGISTTPGLSALPGALTFTTAPSAPAAIRHVNMGSVVKAAAAGSTPARITGRTGPYGGVAATNSTATFTVPGPIASPPQGASNAAASLTRQVNWELSEPPTLIGQMTGAWTTQDRRRMWIWDKDNFYGHHTGVNGLPNLESSCYTNETPTANSGRYERRGTSTGCSAVNRPRTVAIPPATVAQVYFFGFNEAVDNAYVKVTHSADAAFPATVSTANLTGNVVAGQYQTAQLRDRFPFYEGRIPGGQSAADGRSPSPNYYHVAPATSFFTGAPAGYFPQPATPLTTWCAGDILGIRTTLNGVPFQEPVYFCRTLVQ